MASPGRRSRRGAGRLGIAHKEADRIVIDAVHECKAPFDPETCIDDFCVTLKQYRITKVTGDRYAGEFPREQFRKRGISYVCSEKTKSDLYRDLLPIINSGRIVLPKSDRLLNQLCGLERRTARSGRDSIDHAPGGKDDMANALAGAANLIVLAERRQNTGSGVSTYGSIGVSSFGEDAREAEAEPEPFDRSLLPKTADEVCAAFREAWKGGADRNQIVESLRAYRRADGDLNTYNIVNKTIKEITQNNG